jgi:hypothetical protein
MTAVEDYKQKGLTVPDSISKQTLDDMDKAISNFKMGVVSPVVDLRFGNEVEFQRIVENGQKDISY